MRHLAILGAGGHGKVIADIALSLGWTCIDFYDDRWPEHNSTGHWPVLGDKKKLMLNLLDYDGIVVGIGHNYTRLRESRALEHLGAKFPTLIHPSAVVSSYATIGVGTVIMPRAVVNVDTVIGTHCIINTGATVDHDCRIGDGVHVAPGANVAGHVTIGQQVWFGIGASILQQRTIGSNAVVAAGGVVIKNVAEGVTVAGVPAKVLIKEEHCA